MPSLFTRSYVTITRDDGGMASRRCAARQIGDASSTTPVDGSTSSAFRSPVLNFRLKKPRYSTVCSRSAVELNATAETEIEPDENSVNALWNAFDRSVGLLADRKSPRPFTAACTMSSTFAKPPSFGSGHENALVYGVATAFASRFGLPVRPNAIVYVFMCWCISSPLAVNAPCAAPRRSRSIVGTPFSSVGCRSRS